VSQATYHGASISPRYTPHATKLQSREFNILWREWDCATEHIYRTVMHITHGGRLPFAVPHRHGAGQFVRLE